MKAQSNKEIQQAKHSVFARGLFASVVMVAAVVLSLSACTKAKETKSTVSPDAYVTKSDFDGKVFSLVRGIEEADGNNDVGAIPGMSQDFGFVKVRITESEVQFIEVYNLHNKPETQSILASFTIKDHFDIQREANDFGETTHKIVENKERPWNQRAYMRVDWSKPTNDQSALSSFTDFPMVKTENAILLEDAKVENGHVSWLTEFSTSTSSLFGIVFGNQQPNSRVIARTHLMPVKPSDYQRLNYRGGDFQRFGYFYTRQNIENPEKGFLDSELEDNTFANMHNVCEPGRVDGAGKPLSCSTNKIVWHLTKNFPEKYLDVTRRAVSEWNETFKTALGRTDDVVVLDEATPVNFVDPRYNTIAHYGAKSNGGLLGVAQWASNPETGELLGVRTTIYEDGIRGTLGWVDDLITMILSDDEIRQAFLATDAETRERVDKLFQKNSGLKMKSKLRQLRASTRSMVGAANLPTIRERNSGMEVRHSIREISAKLQEPLGRSIARKTNLMKQAPELFATGEQSRLGGPLAGFDETFGGLGAKQAATARLPALGGLEYLHDIGSSLREERARMINQAETGVHGAELVEEAALRYIKKVLAEHPEADDFRKQVDTIKREVDVKTFYTTLLHEMGHTFGLRHNFQGSADAKHYHPEFFRLAKQMQREKNLPDDQKTVSSGDLEPYMFSSIMDYGGDFYSQIGGLGPYDRAAIKYAYNRSINKETDSIVKEGYQFCTDHQVNESILCRRFDKGRNVSEITFNLIESYQTNWMLSHFRRDRANFEGRARRFPMNALTRYFVPVRQVMDEFLFALANSKSVKAGQNECEIDYWKSSVDRGEIVNVCNSVAAEQAGVDPTNLETFEAALFDENGELRKPIDELQAYGLGDLLFANALAKNFFTDVLGSTEPGRFLVLQNREQGGFDLLRLPAGKDMEESLTTFATERNIAVTPDVMDQLKSIAGELKVGRYGKPLDSKWDETGSMAKQQNIGAFWDKYVAMIALGLKDIGVYKYYRHSMTGNAYSYPHTTSFARQIVKAMVAQKDRLARVPFTVPAGSVFASVEPSLNLDMRAIATITALTDFISDGDESIADKMRVCASGDVGCKAPFGQKTVEFMSSSGQDVYRSTQTLAGDSISFELLTSAADIDKQRKEWVTKQLRSSDVLAENIMKLSKLDELRPALTQKLKDLKIEELDKALPILFEADKKQMTVWGMLGLLVTQADKIPLFTTIESAQRTMGAYASVDQMLADQVKAIDPADQCKAENEGVRPSVRPPAVIGLSDKVKIAKTLSALQAQSPGNQSNQNQNAGNGDGAKPAPVDCTVVGPKRAVLVAARTDYQEFLQTVSEMLSSSIDAKAAPLRAKRLTDELARLEASIKLIRKVSKATGLE